MQRRKRCWQQNVLLALSCGFLFSTLGALAQDVAATTAAPLAAAPAAALAAPPAIADVAAANSTADGVSKAPASSEDSARISCRVHIANNTASPATFGHVRSSLKVPAAADVMDVSLVLQVQHPDVAALEVTLVAAGVSGTKAKVVVKGPAFGAVGGANLVQTIFSDYAPSLMPVDASVAPYSSVYRPAQSFKALVSGNGTDAGDGGSKGVWTLTVTDKAQGDVSRRPLKLTGWELWLCGETAGPLFAPDTKADIAAFSGTASSSDATVTVIKKAVPSADNVDVDVLVRAGYRTDQIEQDLVSQAIEKVNTMLSKDIAAKFAAASGQLHGVNPKLAGFLNSSMASTLASLHQLPATMGYLRDSNGAWTLPTSEVVIKSFLDTLVHCHNDLYWCWENAGLQGNLALDFTSTWDKTSNALSAGWSAAQNQWIDAMARFSDQHPELSNWGDALFDSVIRTLYEAAAIDAVTSVGEAYIDTAIRLAIYASPIRYVVNPRAFFTQLLILVSNALRSVFNAFQYVPVLIDGDTNNDVAAITTIASILIQAPIEANAVLLQGVGARVTGMERSLANSAGGLARASADLTSKFGDKLAQISPALGAAFKSGADPIEVALEGLATSQQDKVGQYFKSQGFKAAGLQQDLGQTMNLMGEVAVALARNSAQAFVGAEKALDGVLPGPPVQQVLAGLTKDVQGILSDAGAAFEKLLPLPEIEEMRSLIEATINGTLDILQASAKEVQDSKGAQALRDQLKNLAQGLNGASAGITSVIDGIVKGFPGPLLDSTLAVIERQTNQTVVEIKNLFETIGRDYPAINPKFLVDNLGSLLDQLLQGVLGKGATFESLAPHADVQQLSKALPGVLDAVTTAVPQLHKMALEQLPAAFVGSKAGSDTLRQIDQGIGETLKTYADRVQAVASSFPNQPPLADITNNLQARSQQLAQSSNQLLPAVAAAIAAPTNVLHAGISDLNNGLTSLLKDLDSQSKRAPELAKMLADGPLARVANNMNSTVGKVAKNVASAVDGLSKLLPDAHQLRSQLQDMLGPQVAALDTTVSKASQQAVDAAAAASQGALLGLGQALTGITGLLKDAQFQLAGLLGAAAHAGESLNVTLTGLTGDKKPPELVMLDRNLTALGNSIAKDLNNTLTALRPPIEVLEGVVRPLAAALNQTLGGVTALLTGAPVSTGITGVLQLLTNFAGGAIQGVSGALQLPLPPLPGAGKNDGKTKPKPVSSPSPSPSPSTSTSPSTSPSPSPITNATLEELLVLVSDAIRPTLNSLGVSNATIDAVVTSIATGLFNLGVNDATIASAISQLPPANLGFGNLSGATLAAVQQQLQPLLNSIQARIANGANALQQAAAFGASRGLLHDKQTESAPSDTPSTRDTLDDYIAVVDERIRPALEDLGTDNATISQLVESTASFLFSLQFFPGDVNYAMRAAQDLHTLSPAALAAVQQRLQPVIDAIQARTNGKNGKNDKPQKPEKPSKSDTKKDDKPGKADSPTSPKPQKDDKPQKPQKGDGAAKPALPDFSALFNVSGLQGLVNGDGSAFNPAAFLQQVGKELQKALGSFAQEFTGTLLGAPGVSGSDAAQQVLQGLGISVRDAVSELEKSVASLPSGPVFEYLMNQGMGVTSEASDAAMTTLQQLQQQLVSALDGAGDGLNVTSPEELTQLVRSAGSALQTLAGSPIGQQWSSAAEQVLAQSGVMAQNGGQLVSELASALTPVSEAARQMLQGFSENLSTLVAPLLGGQ